MTHRPPITLPSTLAAPAGGVTILDWDGVKDESPTLCVPGRTSRLMTEMQSKLHLSHAQIRAVMDRLNSSEWFGPMPDATRRATVVVGGQAFHVMVER